MTAAATVTLPLPGGSATDTDGDFPPTVSPGRYRAIPRHHAKGVAIITAGTQTPAGFCANSLASVSLDPPLVSFTIGLRAASWPAIRTARHVTHLLADDQEDLARRFAQPGAESSDRQPVGTAARTACQHSTTRWHA